MGLLHELGLRLGLLVELNSSWFGDRPERFAPWNAATVVCFYPGPGEKRCPAWWKHFIAYARGANGVRTLSDLE